MQIDASVRLFKPAGHFVPFGRCLDEDGDEDRDRDKDKDRKY